MTIATCVVMPEGIVLGADSTSSMFHDSTGFHYFNHNQKIFEIGEDSTFGIVTWGLGQLPSASYRTLIALLADDLKINAPASVLDVVTRWSTLFWNRYNADFHVEVAIANQLSALSPHDSSAPASLTMRTEDQENELSKLKQNFYVGFCIGGYVESDRVAKAYQVEFTPTSTAAPTPLSIEINFWGAPNFIVRLLSGWDQELKPSIIRSGKWTGTEPELEQILNQSALRLSISTLRDAIDFVYSSIHSTIKALKFSDLSQICGGPIEVAVISTDRRFRWVRHKKWDSAIVEGDMA